MTNFELHRHPPSDPALNVELTPESMNPSTDAFWRYRKLSDLVSSHGRPFTADDLKGLHVQASWPEILQFVVRTTSQGPPPDVGTTAGFDVRTLWDCLFDQKNKTVQYRFYLGDEMTEDGRLEHAGATT